MVTRRKLFTDSHEAYKADFYMHMSLNCVEVVMTIVGREKRVTLPGGGVVLLYFDNSKLNAILHRMHGIMRNSKVHHEALSSFIIDRLHQDKKTLCISFVPMAKDAKDTSPLFAHPPPLLISAISQTIQT